MVKMVKKKFDCSVCFSVLIAAGGREKEKETCDVQNSHENLI